MAIIGISRDYGVNPSIVRIITTDNLGTITATNYLYDQRFNIASINGGAFQFTASDMVLVYYNTSAPYYTGGSFIFATLTPDFNTLIDYTSSTVVTPQDIQDNTFTFALDTGIADAIVAAFTPPFTALVDGMSFWIKVANSNATTTPTIAVDGLPITTITLPDGAAVPIGALNPNINYQFEYNATSDTYTVQNPDFIYADQSIYVNYQQLRHEFYTYAVDSGVVNAYVVTFSPQYTNSPPIDGTQVQFITANTNTTTTPTIKIDLLPTAIICAPNGGTLLAGQINTFTPNILIYSTHFGRYVLTNPANPNSGVLLTNPKVSGNIFDSNGNFVIGVGSVPSAVNYVEVENAITGATPVIAAVGTDTNIILAVEGQGNGGAAIQGKTSGTGYASGYVSELKTASVTYVSSTPITTATPTNLAALTLTAGDWDVWGNVGAAGTTVTQLQGGLNTASTTNLPAFEYCSFLTPLATSSIAAICVPMVTLNISSTTVINLTMQANGTGSLIKFGTIYARRR